MVERLNRTTEALLVFQKHQSAYHEECAKLRGELANMQQELEESRAELVRTSHELEGCQSLLLTVTQEKNQLKSSFDTLLNLTETSQPSSSSSPSSTSTPPNVQSTFSFSLSNLLRISLSNPSQISLRSLSNLSNLS